MPRVPDAGEELWAGWMAAAQRGDTEAYERLLLAIRPALRRYVRARGAESDVVDDVVQNVLISIHQARHTFRPERPFGPWMRAIARNALVDAQRAQTRRRRREPLAGESGLPEIPVEPAELDEGLSPSLRAALAELPPSQREAVELLHFEQLRVAEAAERAGTTPGALKVRAHRGYKALRAKLAPPGSGDE